MGQPFQVGEHVVDRLLSLRWRIRAIEAANGARFFCVRADDNNAYQTEWFGATEIAAAPPAAEPRIRRLG